MDEWMKEKMKEWMKEKMKEWMKGRNEWMKEPIVGVTPDPA